MSEEPNKKQSCEDRYEWLCAYMDAGFSRAEAMRFLAQPIVTINAASTFPPELYEFWERQNTLALRAIEELDE